MKAIPALAGALVLAGIIQAATFGALRGIVHDPDCRPVPAADVIVKSNPSDETRTLATDAQGIFEITALPVGAYTVTVGKDGFAPSMQAVVVTSGSAPVLHFQLVIGAQQEQVTVS